MIRFFSYDPSEVAPDVVGVCPCVMVILGVPYAGSRAWLAMLLAGALAQDPPTPPEEAEVCG